MKHYILSYSESGWQAEFDVDLDKAKAPCMESLQHFGDPITREDDSAEEIVRAFLRFWGPDIIQTSTNNAFISGDPERMIEALRNRDGMPPLDGSCGVKMVYCDNWDYSSDDFSVASGEEEPQS